MKIEFTREDTKVIKGLSILLMLMHHLWGFPSRIGINYNTFSIFSEEATIYFAKFAKICVPIYTFLGGYGTYKILSKNEKTVFEQIKKLYISYWKVFLVFIPIAFIFFNNQIARVKDSFIYPRYNVFDFSEFFSNLFGISATYNGEWWFLLCYVIVLISYPLFIKIFSKHSTSENIFLIVIMSILLENVTPQIGIIKPYNLNSNYLYKLLFSSFGMYHACFLLGVLFAKDDLLIKLNDRIKKNIKMNSLTDLIIIFSIIFLRSKTLSSMDLVYVPVFIIVAKDLLTKNNLIKNIFKKMGEQSTNMWLIHTFFCYYFFSIAESIIIPNFPILSLIILIIITYASSISLDFFWEKVNVIYKKIISNQLKQKG